MPEVNLVGVNEMTYPALATWGWPVALYLFLGGLIAGLMILGSGARILRWPDAPALIRIGDWVGLPALVLGLLLLWIDLENRWNAWRLFTTFRWESPMSWGSWILLLTGIVLALGFLRIITPAEQPARNRLARAVQAVRNGLARLGHWRDTRGNTFEWLVILLGIGLGTYTGVLLGTISARPLWSSAALPLLFLVSGLASAGALLCLVLPHTVHRRLAPLSVAMCVVELLILLAYTISLSYGPGPSQAAWRLLLTGMYGWAFWGGVVGLGILIPLVLESLELRGAPLGILTRVPPAFKLVGSVALRSVIVFAGLASAL